MLIQPIESKCQVKSIFACILVDFRDIELQLYCLLIFLFSMTKVIFKMSNNLICGVTFYINFVTASQTLPNPPLSQSIIHHCMNN